MLNRDENPVENKRIFQLDGCANNELKESNCNLLNLGGSVVANQVAEIQLKFS